MFRKTINCQSCEIKCDIIVTQTNYETEEIDIEYCPVCSALQTEAFEIDDEDEFNE